MIAGGPKMDGSRAVLQVVRDTPRCRRPRRRVRPQHLAEPGPGRMVRALRHLIHADGTVEEALQSSAEARARAWQAAPAGRDRCRHLAHPGPGLHARRRVGRGRQPHDAGRAAAAGLGAARPGRALGCDPRGACARRPRSSTTQRASRASPPRASARRSSRSTATASRPARSSPGMTIGPGPRSTGWPGDRSRAAARVLRPVARSDLLALQAALAEGEPARCVARTVRWLNVTHYLAWRLCGEMTCDPSLASRTLALDLHKRAWADDLIAEAGLSPDLFAPIRPNGARLGQVTAEWPPRDRPAAGLRGRRRRPRPHRRRAGPWRARARHPVQLARHRRGADP